MSDLFSTHTSGGGGRGPLLPKVGASERAKMGVQKLGGLAWSVGRVPTSNTVQAGWRHGDVEGESWEKSKRG